MQSVIKKQTGKILCRSILGLTLCCLTALHSLSANRITSEYEVKAAYIYNFIKFIDWPAGTFNSPKAPINIGIYGDDEFAALLQTIIKNKTIQERPITSTAIKRPADLKNYQLVFISDAELKKSRKILDDFQGLPIITVTEAEPGSNAKGLINFFIEGNKVLFEIDIERADKARLMFSSKLLRLARGNMTAHWGERRTN